MNINWPSEGDKLYRVHSIHKDPSDDERKDSKKGKKGHYRGREWSEEDENIAVVPFTQTEIEPSSSQHTHLIEQAKKDLDHLITLEEKIAQLIFWKTDASYDSDIQDETEEAILRSQVGGLYFSEGTYKRQAYLIEHYQQLAKTSLIICNGLLHSLSLYFEEDNPMPKRRDSNIQMAIDLGKTIMGQNKALKINIQCTSDPNENPPFFDEDEEKAFSKGIRDAHGIIGKIKPSCTPIKEEKLSTMAHNDLHFFEMGGNKTLHLIDFSPEDVSKEKIVENFYSRSDGFLVSKNIRDFISLIAELVNEGKISESAIDKKVLKILLLKRIK